MYQDSYALKQATLEFETYIKNSDVIISSMCKTFDKKKNAHAEQKRTHKKSGVLDSKRLASYKFSEDLFRKRTIVPNQKSHSVHVLLDWSGSITHELIPMIKQAINLARFCRKSGIFFRVCCFTDCSPGGRSEYQKAIGINSRAQIVEFLSSDMSGVDFKEACKQLYFVACSAANKTFGSNRLPGVPGYSLGGTPLNECLIAFKSVIDDDVETKKIQNPNLIVLTDGASSGIGYFDINNKYGGAQNQVTFIDPRNNKKYCVKEISKNGYKGFQSGTDSYGVTNTIISWYNDFGINTVQMYMSRSNPVNMATQMVGGYCYNESLNMTLLKDLEENSNKLLGRSTSKKDIGVLENFNGYKKSYFINPYRSFGEETTIFSRNEDDDEDYDDEYDEDYEDEDEVVVPVKKQKEITESAIDVGEKKTINGISKTFTNLMSGISNQKLVGELIVSDLCKNF